MDATFKNAVRSLINSGWSETRVRAFVTQTVDERCRYDDANLRDEMHRAYSAAIDAVVYARDGLRVYPRRSGKLFQGRA